VLIEVKVYPIIISLPGTVMLLLMDKVSKSRMPIFIDPCNARAVSRAIKGGVSERPQVHDLLKSFLVDDLNIVVTKVVITELKNNDTYYALIYYDKDGKEKTKDSRPSDAIVLSLLFNSPIFVEEELWLRSLTDRRTRRHLDQFELLERRLGIDNLMDTDKTDA